jgi:hypothetical protein
VIITVEIITPIKIISNDRENRRSNKTAISDPSPSPVKGSGIATKNNNATVSYVVTLSFARRRIMGNPQSIALFHLGNLLRNNSTLLKKVR